MKKIDMRLNEAIFREMVGKQFLKYKCDPFVYANSVTAIVGLYIGDEIFELNNNQTTVDYFGTEDDCAVFSMKKIQEDSIVSLFDDVEQIDTPVAEAIRKITLVNENQRIYENGEQTYNVWLTRGIIFHFKEREISFEKDNVPFSEEIIIQRGYNLIDKFSSKNDFLEGWDKNKTPECIREAVIIE